jgi:hypothetical protein
MNSTSKGPIRAAFEVADRDQLGAAEQAGLVDAVLREPERERGAEHGEPQVTQQVLQRADVVLVAVRDDAALDALGVLAQPREVGQHEVDAVHVDVGEHEPAVDEKDALVVLDRHAVAADLTEPAEEDDPDGRRRAVARRGEVRHASGTVRKCIPPALQVLPHLAGSRLDEIRARPSGSRACPTGIPRWRIIAFDGIGFGASSPVSNANDSSMREFTRRAPDGVALLPQVEHLLVVAPVQCVATPIVPTIPLASSGSVRTSSPPYASKPAGAERSAQPSRRGSPRRP